MPIVTIIMPAYNVENYISPSIESVLRQNFKDWELIIINDGSTDQTKNIAESYAKKDPRVKVINQINSGVSAARNAGLNHVGGEYVSFLDADDQYDPQYIELMLNALLSSNTEVAFCKFKELKGAEILRKTPEHVQSLYKDNFILHIGNVPHSKVNMAFMYQTNHLRKLGYLFNTSISNAEDTEFILKVTYNSRVCFVPAYLYLYIYRENSLSRDVVTSMRVTNKIHTYTHCREYFINNTNKNEEEYVRYLNKEISILFETLRRILWNDLVQGNFSQVNNGLNYYQEKISADLQIDNDYIYKYNPIKNFLTYLKLKILNSRSKFIWKLVAFKF